MSTDTYDRWLPRIIRLLAAVVGLGIMVFETIVDQSDRPWLYAAAITLIGLPAAQAGERLLGKITGTGPGAPPPAAVLPPVETKPTPVE